MMILLFNCLAFIYTSILVYPLLDWWFDSISFLCLSIVSLWIYLSVTLYKVFASS
jgi:hypothetical protein